MNAPDALPMLPSRMLRCYLHAKVNRRAGYALAWMTAAAVLAAGVIGGCE